MTIRPISLALANNNVNFGQRKEKHSSYPLRTANQAEGNIKRFQLFECTLLLMIVPVSYIGLLIGFPPECVFLVHLVIECVAQIVRIIIVTPKIRMTSGEYIKNVYIVVMPILITGLLVTIVINLTLPSNVYRFITNILITEVVLSSTILYYGLKSEERKKMFQIIKDKIRHG